MTQPYGWNIDPYGLHEHRYFSGGQPTKLVRDGGRESYDEPPDSPPPAVHPGSPIGPQPSAVAVVTRAEVGPVLVDEASRIDDRGSAPSRPRCRRPVPLLACAVVLGLVVALVFVLVPGSGPPSQRSACSLLTTTEAGALLGYAAASLHLPAGYLPAGMSSCSFGPTPSEMRNLERKPQSFEESYRTLQLTIEKAPAGFPSTAFRKFATPVPVDGRTAWWSSLQPVPVPGPSSSSAHALVAVKNGQEIMIQLTTTGQAEEIDQRAMADSLLRI